VLALRFTGFELLVLVPHLDTKVLTESNLTVWLSLSEVVEKESQRNDLASELTFNARATHCLLGALPLEACLSYLPAERGNYEEWKKEKICGCQLLPSRFVLYDDSISAMAGVLRTLVFQWWLYMSFLKYWLATSLWLSG